MEYDQLLMPMRHARQSTPIAADVAAARDCSKHDQAMVRKWTKRKKVMKMERERVRALEWNGGHDCVQMEDC